MATSVFLYTFDIRSPITFKKSAFWYIAVLLFHSRNAQANILSWYKYKYTVAENQKLCKIYLKKLFFQNVLAFIDLFYRYFYKHYFIYSDYMDVICAQCVIQQNKKKTHDCHHKEYKRMFHI